MAFSANLLQNLIPISQFNRGQASHIFDRLRTEKQLIVLKNNQPSAVILSPEEYARLTEIEEDYLLLLDANQRLAKKVTQNNRSLATVLSDLNIDDKELEETEDVEIE